MKILIVDDCQTIGTAIASVLKNSTEPSTEIIMGGYPFEEEFVKVIPYEKCQDPRAFKKRERDWEHHRSKNQYKQKRRGKR